MGQGDDEERVWSCHECPAKFDNREDRVAHRAVHVPAKLSRELFKLRRKSTGDMYWHGNWVAADNMWHPAEFLDTFELMSVLNRPEIRMHVPISDIEVVAYGPVETLDAVEYLL